MYLFPFLSYGGLKKLRRPIFLRLIVQQIRRNDARQLPFDRSCFKFRATINAAQNDWFTRVQGAGWLAFPIIFYPASGTERKRSHFERAIRVPRAPEGVGGGRGFSNRDWRKCFPFCFLYSGGKCGLSSRRTGVKKPFDSARLLFMQINSAVNKPRVRITIWERFSRT